MFSTIESFETNWSTSDHEYNFLGACLEYFGKKTTFGSLLRLLSAGVDETWFINEKTRALYIGISQASMLIGRDDDTIVGYNAIIDKAESYLEQLSPGNVGFCQPLIQKCKNSISYFDLSDFVEIDIPVWHNKLKKHEVRSIARQLEHITEGEYKKDTSQAVMELIHKAEDAWTSQPISTNKKTELLSSVRDLVLAPRPENSHISTGMKVLDFILGGGLSGPGSLEEGKLLVLLARPGQGKTLLATSLAAKIAKSGHKVAFWSLEMKDKQIGLRILAGLDFEEYGMYHKESAVTYDMLRKHNLSDDARLRFQNHDYSAIDKNLFVYSGDAYLTAESICQRMRLIKKREPDTALFVIDHLHLLKLEQGNEVSSLGECTRLLKTTAVELGVDVLLLCQLNRGIEGRQEKMPQPSDARGSGRIEEDADVIIGLLRPHVYDPTEDPELLQIGVGKNRQGECGKFPLKVNLQCCSVYEQDFYYE